MPKPSQIPRYRHHKARNCGIVTLSGRDIYLPGPHNSEESRRAYERLIAEWLANGKRPPQDHSIQLTVAELVIEFLKHAQLYYRRPDGDPSAELDCFRYALRPMVRLYADVPAVQFGPLALRAVREQMIADGWSRTYINRQINRLKHVFKWAAGHELVVPSVHQGLAAVAGLKRGRSQAAETQPVKPVPMAHVNAIEPFVSRQVWALIQLQLLTAARAGELVTMRPIDLDTSGRIWVFAPAEHKTAHHGHQRAIYLGPRAQVIAEPFLSRPVEAFMFSPAEAEQERREAIHQRRKTPISCGNRPGSNRRRKPKRQPAEQYTVDSYRRAIARACDKAMPHPSLSQIPLKKLTEQQRSELQQWQRNHRWHPHQLRHNAATSLRKEFGIETARVILGHRSPAITEVYAELDKQQAVRTMELVG